jgi:hypothetical protein
VHRLIFSRSEWLAWFRAQVIRWCDGSSGERQGAAFERWTRPAEMMPLPQEATPDEQAAILAAIHDLCAKYDADLIGPLDREADGDQPAEVTDAAQRFMVLRVVVADLPATAVPILQRYLKAMRRKLRPPFEFSPDFRSVQWGDQEFTFSLCQAACLNLMNGRGWIGAHFILANAPDYYPDRSKNAGAVLDKLEFSRRLRDLFRGHPAWGTMIVAHETTKNLYRLVPPAGVTSVHFPETPEKYTRLTRDLPTSEAPDMR